MNYYYYYYYYLLPTRIFKIYLLFTIPQTPKIKKCVEGSRRKRVYFHKFPRSVGIEPRNFFWPYTLSSATKHLDAINYWPQPSSHSSRSLSYRQLSQRWSFLSQMAFSLKFLIPLAFRHCSEGAMEARIHIYKEVE